MEGAARGPAASVRPGRYAQALGARTSRAPCHCGALSGDRDPPSTEGCWGTGACPDSARAYSGVSRNPCLFSARALQRLGLTPRGDTGFVSCSALQRGRVDRGSPAAAGCRGASGQGLAGAGTARARPQERAGLGVRLARVSAGASGRREAGATGWAREAGWGLRSRLQSLARQRGATRGRAARSRRLSGAHRLGTRTPSPPYRRSGVQRCPCPCPGVAAMAAPLGRARFPREGRVLWAGGAGTAPLRLWAEPLHVDGDRLSSPAACLVSETRRQNAHPAPIGAPALSPQSPSFALLRQHHALARSRSREKLRHQAWFPEPAGTVETLPESSTAWKSYHLGSLRPGGIGLCVCVCAGRGVC